MDVFDDSEGMFAAPPAGVPEVETLTEDEPQEDDPALCMKDGRCNELKPDGTYCRAFTMDNGKCQHHGGERILDLETAVIGLPIGPRTRARFLPKRLRKRFDELNRDEHLYRQREDIVLLDTRLTELLDALNSSGGAARLWKKLVRKRRAYGNAKDSRHQAVADNMLDSLFKLIDDGADDFDAWASIVMLLEQRRKIVESERKRMVEMQQMMSTAQAMLFMQQVTKVIQDHVKDPLALQGIALGLTNIIDAPTGTEA